MKQMKCRWTLPNSALLASQQSTNSLHLARLQSFIEPTYTYMYSITIINHILSSTLMNHVKSHHSSSFHANLVKKKHNTAALINLLISITLIQGHFIYKRHKVSLKCSRQIEWRMMSRGSVNAILIYERISRKSQSSDEVEWQ